MRERTSLLCYQTQDLASLLPDVNLLLFLAKRLAVSTPALRTGGLCGGVRKLGFDHALGQSV
jgi:hypothetical protein